MGESAAVKVISVAVVPASLTVFSLLQSNLENMPSRSDSTSAEAVGRVGPAACSSLDGSPVSGGLSSSSSPSDLAKVLSCLAG
jgi:hypothetical protein